MSKGFQNDLTEGHVAKQLLRFSIPFLLANLLQALYNMADMLIVGQFDGAIGAAAVGVGGQVKVIRGTGDVAVRVGVETLNKLLSLILKVAFDGEIMGKVKGVAGFILKISAELPGHGLI